MSDRESFLQTFDAKLKDWDAKINQFKTQAKLADADTQQRYQNHLHRMVTQRNLLHTKLTEMRKAKGDSWRSMKEGMEKAWEEIEQAFQSALTRLQ